MVNTIMGKKVIFITGASMGLGKITAEYLSKKGHSVIGTSRNALSVDTIEVTKNQSYPLLVQMDVTDDTSIEKVLYFVQNQFGRIDVLINNAGIGISGPVEETPIDQAKMIFETNFFGMLQVTKKIIPLMRKRKKGLIINTSSIGGVIGLPYQGLYSATKFAIEGISEALRMELQSFGIRVVLVEPGDFKTSFTKNRKKILDDSSPYSETVKKTTAVFEHDEQQGTDPIKLAYLMEKIMTSSHPKVRYRVGSFSQKFVASLKGVISDRILQWILMKYYKLK